MVEHSLIKMFSNSEALRFVFIFVYFLTTAIDGTYTSNETSSPVNPSDEFNPQTNSSPIINPNNSLTTPITPADLSTTPLPYSNNPFSEFGLPSTFVSNYLASLNQLDPNNALRTFIGLQQPPSPGKLIIYFYL